MFHVSKYASRPRSPAFRRAGERSMSICSIDPAPADSRPPETGRLKIKLYATIQENYIPL